MPYASLPPVVEIMRVYTTLVRRQVVARGAPVWTVGSRREASIGTYEDSAKVLSALWLADLSLTATLGAALTLIPPAVAGEAIRAQRLPEAIVEGAREIANITANSFAGVRLRLERFVPPGEPVDGAVAALLARPAQRLDLTVDISGYPGGRLTFLGR